MSDALWKIFWPTAMVKRSFWTLRSRSVTLSTKILVLLLAAVVFSTGLAGWLIYDGLRERAWSDAGEALLQSATSSAVGMRIEGLEDVHGPADRSNLAYQNLRHALRELYRRNHFNLENRWGRLSVLRFTPSKSEVVLVASMESAGIGQSLPLDGALYKAAATQEAELKDDSGEPDWLVAYAPLGQVKDAVYVLKLERNTLFIRRELLGHLGTILLGALVGLVLTLVSGWLVTGQITKPLRTFVDVMKLMQSTGDFDMKIDLHPEDRDMSVVESTFQSLVRRMQDSREREEQSYWSTLQALVTALDVRDNETAGHSMRVTRYSLAIGERMRLRPEAMEQLRQGALLHDIGKIGVPDAILRKPGRLTSEEWVEMRKHPAIGRTFLEDIVFLRPAMAVVYCHHERWDGTGYPQGLAAEAIPLTARVFAVADALDAITSRRYYKEARSFREAQVEIEACASTHFDPAVVKAFLSIPEKMFLRIRQETSLSGLELDRLRKGAA
jgi:HD-GYP domain-containing protein (c-di-GMP phosphodiesterase class II)